MNRFLSVFRKSLLEQIRSPWELVFILLCAPLFVGMYWFFFAGGSTTYTLLVLNQDDGPHGQKLAAQVAAVAYPDGRPLLKLVAVSTRSEADEKLRNRDAAAMLLIPPGFSRRLDDFCTSGVVGEGDPLLLTGDLTNPTYSVAAILAAGVVEDFLRAETGQPRPVALVEAPLGGSGTRTEFEIYVPGLFVVAMVLMVFSAAARVAAEIESGGFKRLALTHLTPLEYLAGVSAVQLLVGLATVLVTFGTAVALGFRSHGPLWVALLIGMLTAFSVIGVGLIVAAFSRTTTEAFIFANLPMILMMFFSGAVFPLPKIPLFSLAGRTIGLFDFIPQTHAVLALNKVLTLGAGLGDVLYEVLLVLLLSLGYFGLGVWVFGRRVMRR